MELFEIANYQIWGKEMVRGYQIPETLQRLFRLDEQLVKKYGKKFDDFFGARLTFEEEGYDCTPDDAIVFLWTGADGDHFVFLTDGDTVDSLEEAPIFFIQPMSFSDPYKPVAKNIKEFLALYVQLRELYLFEWLPSYKTEEAFLQHYKDEFEKDILENKQDQDVFIAAIEQEIQLPKIERVFVYIQELNGLFQKRLKNLKKSYDMNG
ncbi:hypothetical protein [Paenibacillus hubeiensis]|uniref:hypothetical protein n=1 Tax=Paenibacillus hubeiensis TaxID=3077330 RepID=UPI0031BBC502